MFAIIDIETTGGQPDKDKITEIAILIHDGEKVTDSFSTLINPNCSIPTFISQYTGITNEMVMDAPPFYEVAKKVVELTEGKIFVAHNVRFDYNFIKAAFRDLGYNYHRDTLCTVRLSRQAFPGYPSYSLGKICAQLGIEIKARHRAMGDAEATAILFTKIMKQGTSADIAKMVPSEIKKSAIPPLLSETVLNAIPEKITGVYYFHNANGDVIYVGKAVDIRKRITQHLALTGKGNKKAMLLKAEIADITYENTGSELVALLLESDEIKRIRPIYNHAQMRSSLVPFYGIFANEDSKGYTNLVIQKIKKGEEPLRIADNMMSARAFFYRIIENYKLCLAKCDLHNTPGPCFHHQIHNCNGACIAAEPPEEYNKRVADAITTFSFQSESFLILGKGRHEQEKSVVCVEYGQYIGFGYFDETAADEGVGFLRSRIKFYSHNRDIQQILCTALKKKHTKIAFNPRLEWQSD